MTKPKRSQKKPSNSLRIIAGQWRGRKLTFPDAIGLRPTGDRIRETLFNWLAPEVPGSRCLDLFAGSGALGLEAASRGANRVLMVEKAGNVAKQLQQNCQLLDASNIEIINADALALLQDRSSEKFDLVFLDPPFDDDLWDRCCLGLEQGDWLKDKATIYLEAPTSHQLAIPSNWSLHREKQAGSVCYRVYRREPE